MNLKSTVLSVFILLSESSMSPTSLAWEFVRSLFSRITHKGSGLLQDLGGWGCLSQRNSTFCSPASGYLAVGVALESCPKELEKLSLALMEWTLRRGNCKKQIHKHFILGNGSEGKWAWLLPNDTSFSQAVPSCHTLSMALGNAAGPRGWYKGWNPAVPSVVLSVGRNFKPLP